VNVLKSVLIAATLAFAAPAIAAEASGPSAGHPLSPLFDMIAGGEWQPATPAYPDEIRTTMTFAWDSAVGQITGTSVRTGGIAGIRQITDVVFAYDAENDTITVTRTPNEALSTKITGQTPKTVTGTVTLNDTGFQMRFESMSTAVEMMITAVQFETPDTWVERSEILSNGTSNLGTEIRYVLKKE